MKGLSHIKVFMAGATNIMMAQQQKAGSSTRTETHLIGTVRERARRVAE